MRKAGRPLVPLTTEEHAESKNKVLEYQKEYRKNHQSNPKILNHFVKRIKTVEIKSQVKV